MYTLSFALESNGASRISLNTMKLCTLASSVCLSVYAVVSFSFKPILVIFSFSVYYSKENNANDTAKLGKVALCFFSTS